MFAPNFCLEIQCFPDHSSVGKWSGKLQSSPSKVFLSWTFISASHKKCELFWYIHSKHNKSKIKKKQPTFGQNVSPAFCSETNCLYLQLVILQQHLFVASLTQHQSVAKTFPDFSFINAQMHSFWSLQGRSWLEIFTICSFSYLILLSKISQIMKFSLTFLMQRIVNEKII